MSHQLVRRQRLLDVEQSVLVERAEDGLVLRPLEGAVAVHGEREVGAGHGLACRDAPRPRPTPAPP